MWQTNKCGIFEISADRFWVSSELEYQLLLTHDLSLINKDEYYLLNDSDRGEKDARIINFQS
jgi:hypothetical protein